MRLWTKTAWFTALIGLIDSIYLTILKVSNNRSLCIQGVGDCWSVNTSIYSEIFGIPIAVLGMAAYGLVLFLLWIEQRNPWMEKYTDYFLFGVTLIGVIYSAYLTYLEIAVIKAICPFCVISAVAMVILFVYTVKRLVEPSGNES
ncbi:MAG: vitamin K epoxide reductase family protein [Chloroflexota bacterium]